jgi:Bifunctional DNA primase/polymerase, N-terminal
MSRPVESSPRDRRRLRTAAIEYVKHGWPVAPLAVPARDACPCGDDCRTMHPLDGHAEGITSLSVAKRVWADAAWQLAIVTAWFDVVDLPGSHGSRIHGQLKTRCPTATARPGRRLDWMVEPGPVRWHLYLRPGSVDPEKVATAGGRLHSGPADWIPAPPSRTPVTGRVAWVVPPRQARWSPYQRADVFDLLGLG